MSPSRALKIEILSLLRHALLPPVPRPLVRPLRELGARILSLSTK